MKNKTKEKTDQEAFSEYALAKYRESAMYDARYEGVFAAIVQDVFQSSVNKNK